MHRKKWKPRNVSWLYTYFFSHLIIFFVPLVLMGTVSFYWSVGKLNEEILLNYKNRLEQVAKDMDRQLANLASLALDISNDKTFLPYNLKKSQYGEIEAVKTLKRYGNNMFLPRHAFLYYKGEEQLYSSEGKYDNGIFFEHEIRLPQWQTLLADIDRSDIPFYTAEEHVYFRNAGLLKTFIYVYPISTSQSLYKDAALVYFVTSQEVEQRIENVLGVLEGNFYLFGPGNERIISVEKQHPVDVLASQTHAIGQDGTEYNVFKTVSPATTFGYALAMPSSSLLSNATQLKNVMMYVLMVSLAGGLIGAWFFAYRNYSPIKKLQSYVQNAFPASAPDNGRDELATIGRAFDTSLISNESLRAQVGEQQSLIRQNWLQALLKGHWVKHTDVGVNAMPLQLEGPYYGVMAVRLVAGGHFAHKETAVKLVEHQAMDAGSVYAVDLLHENHVAVIFSMPENDVERMMNWAEELQQHCRERHMEMKFGIGNMCSLLEEVKVSYIEAVSALEFGPAAAGIVLFREIVKNDSNFLWYPSEKLLNLLQAVKQGNGPLAVEMLDRLNADMKEQQLSFIMEKLISFEVLNALLRTVYDLNIQVSHQDLKTLGTLENTDALFEQLGRLVYKVSDKVSQTREDGKEKLARDIVGYVNQHFLEYDMSLEKLAARFELSLYVLGKLFKDATGVGFKDYLIRLRMDEAKRLLGESDKNVLEIAADIGYANVSHFIKMFKKLEGRTPAEFRQMHKL